MAFSGSNINIIEQCKISPPPASVSSPTSIPLTIFDIFMSIFPPVQRLLFYDLHHSKPYFLETVLPNIKHSLSLTLQHFFPLAGNITWPQASSLPEIQYINGDYVLLTVAESGSDNDFSSLVGNHAKSANGLHTLAPKLLMKVSTANNKCLPIMAIQVTVFPNQGICIGITYSHSAADGKTLNHFIKSWASRCKLQGRSSNDDDGSILSIPSYDRSLLVTNTDLNMSCLNYLKRYNITRDTFYLSKDNHYDYEDKVLATFVMRPHTIKRLRQWVLSRVSDKKSHLSAFVLTTAYVWVCLSKAQSSERVAEEGYIEYFGFLVDFRLKVDPPLPVTYFGNCLIPVLVESKRIDLVGEDGVLIAAELIGNAIQKMEDGDGILENIGNFLLTEFTFIPDQTLTVAGSTKFGIYQTDFGWGTPKKSEVISISGTGAISLTECSTEAGGVEIGLVRKTREVEAFTSLFANTIERFVL
ncbi:hypothetical protein ACHQM5_012182 [Ranunculus cassubicifolius]